MRIFQILLISLFISFFSCKKEDKNIISNEQNKESELDSISIKKEADVQSHEISLDPIKSDIPTFTTNSEAEAFVSKTKSYFEQISEASKKGDMDKVMELQLKSVDIDTEYQKVKSKLNVDQKKQLTNWYMKLVEAASK